MKGIDISHWNGSIDFNKVKKDGIDFVIIKAGGSDKGFYSDSKFRTNYFEALKAGLHIGCYYFVGKNCKSFADGIADAERFIKIIKGMKFDFPVVIDYEVGSRLTRKGNTEAVVGFCSVMESKGYYVSIYASDISGFKEQLDISKLEVYDKWVARYGTEPTYIKSYGIWQYSSKGSVAGIAGNVDLDIAYKNYPDIIKKNHLNGW